MLRLLLFLVLGDAPRFPVRTLVLDLSSPLKDGESIGVCEGSGLQDGGSLRATCRSCTNCMYRFLRFCHSLRNLPSSKTSSKGVFASLAISPRSRAYTAKISTDAMSYLESCKISHLMQSDLHCSGLPRVSVPLPTNLETQVDLLRFTEERHGVEDLRSEALRERGSGCTGLIDVLCAETAGEHALVVVPENAIVGVLMGGLSCAAEEAFALCNLEDEGEGETWLDATSRQSGKGPGDVQSDRSREAEGVAACFELE